LVYNTFMSTDVLNRGKIRVGVLRGGPSGEYEVSLQTGATVLKNLPERYSGHDILISRDGVWHWSGIPRVPEKVLNNVDVVFNALHGNYGEDGKVQSVLEQFKIPYTGSRPVPSSISMNKTLSKKFFREKEIKTPVSIIFHPAQHVHSEALELFRSFPQPSVIKPASGGSSIGVTVTNNFLDFEKGIEIALRHGSAALVEEFIRGKEVSVTVLESSKDHTHYSLSPVEIVHRSPNNFFDYNCKYEAGAQKICPAENISLREKEQVQQLALRAHRTMGLRHYSNSDFIIHPSRGIYLLEVNSLPGLTTNSLLPIALISAGISVSDFLEHVLSLALQ